ncbi:MAG: alpha/beta fold hydrolase, partial [Alphaproteobacteria bacterium]|nr:alpha/beta fold hydrolase [Alphaproteobacteria bacterium]
ELDLGQYAQAFEAEEIGLGHLPKLTESDLKELGLPMGPRKSILEAAAALAGMPAIATEDIPTSAAKVGAERRQLTVMFCDLVGSTALSAQIDPEELRAVMGRYQKTAGAVIARYDGHVAQYLGDGLMTYFGWPTAHEDDAERAVRAGLEIVDAVKAIAAPVPLEVRIGIATGPVVVGETGAGDASVPKAAVGQTPNLAARLQALAEPASVIIADSTRRLIGGAFDLEDLGPVELKGVDGPRATYRVRGHGAAQSRFEATTASGLTPLVGRETEGAMLDARWSQAKGGEGQAVLLSGEPGIGKSRIVQELRARVGDEPHFRLRYQCSPYFAHSAFHPFVEQLSRAAGFAADDDPEAKLDKLEALLSQAADQVGDVAPLLAAILGLPGDRYVALDADPQRRKEGTIAALAEQLAGLAEHRPVLLIFEDTQWIDSTSLEVLDALVARIENIPVLILISYRPEFQPPWAGLGHVTMLSLNRLGRRECAAIAAKVPGGAALPDSVLDQIVARTDGVPLFAEELTRSVVEAGLAAEGDDPQAGRDSAARFAIPSSLRDSLTARLDRLGPAKEIAQIGAVIGSPFEHRLLARVSPLPPSKLEEALAKLLDSGLVLCQGQPPDATYRFKNALVVDVAYESLLKSTRQRVHAVIAASLAESFPETVERAPELLARHYQEAGDLAKAATHRIRAGYRAMERYAHPEAIAQFEASLELLGDGSVDTGLTPDATERRITALVALGDIASQAGDLDGANQRYERAIAATADPDARSIIENKRHRPEVATRDGAKIVYYLHGSGEPTLLFVNPIVYGLAIFQPVLERLCQDFRIVTIDCRGTGGSDALSRPYSITEHVKDVAAVIERLGDGPVIGVGVSRGGILLAKVIAKQPGLITKMVTIGTPLGPTAGYRKMNPDDDLYRVVALHAALIFTEPDTRYLRDLFIEGCRRLPWETVRSFYDVDPELDIVEILDRNSVPTLVTHGTKDKLIPFSAATFLAENIPDAQLHAFEGQGHLPIFTATDQFCDILRRFVDHGTVS